MEPTPKKTFVPGVFQTGRHVISRLRGDTIFYDPPTEPAPGQRGRPRKFGAKRKAREWAQEATGWREVIVGLYGKTATLKIKIQIAMHRRLDVTITIVAVCWQQNKQNGKQSSTTICHSPVFLFSTDTGLTDEEIVRAYGSRFCSRQVFVTPSSRSASRHTRCVATRASSVWCICVFGRKPY